jgi:hypothetical protein
MPEAVARRAPEEVREIFRQTVAKIKLVLPKTRFQNINSVKIGLTRNFEYLREIVDNVQISNHKAYNMLQMSSYDLSKCKLFYDASRQILLNDQGQEASTINKFSKNIQDVQAFVMDKQSNIYMVTHKGYFKNRVHNFTHASFLQGRPLEIAGMISIREGKIYSISDSSGHYAPEGLDMYRGIKKIQKSMPGVFYWSACISLSTQPEPLLIRNFIGIMEVPNLNGGSLCDRMLMQRIRRLLDEEVHITQFKEILKIKSNQNIQDIIANLKPQEVAKIRYALENEQKLNLVIQPDPNQKLNSTVHDLDEVSKLMVLYAKEDLIMDLMQKNRFDIIRKIVVNSYEKGGYAELINKIFANQEVFNGIMEYDLTKMKSSSILHFAAYNLDENTINQILQSRYADKLILYKDHNNLIPLEYAQKHRHRHLQEYTNLAKVYKIEKLLKQRAQELEFTQRQKDLSEARNNLQIQENYIPLLNRRNAIYHGSANK